MSEKDLNVSSNLASAEYKIRSSLSQTEKMPEKLGDKESIPEKTMLTTLKGMYPECKESHDDKIALEGDLHVYHVINCGNLAMTCKFSPDGSLFAVGLNNGIVKLFSRLLNPSAGRSEIQIVPATHTYGVFLHYTINHLQVYSTKNGKLIKKLGDNIFISWPVTALRFYLSLESRSLILVTYADGFVKLWHVWGGECLWSIKEHSEGHDTSLERHTLSLAVSQSKRIAATGGSDAAIYLYDLNTQQKLQNCLASSSSSVMDGHRLKVFAVTFHPEKQTEFISGGWDNTVQFWDIRQPRAVRRLYGPHICGEALQINPSGSQILCGSWKPEESLQIWDYFSGTHIANVPEDTQGKCLVYTCQWLENDNILAGGCQENMLRIVHRQSLTTVSLMQGLSSPVHNTSVCLEGKWMGRIAATSGKFVYLLDRKYCQ